MVFACGFVLTCRLQSRSLCYIPCMTRHCTMHDKVMVSPSGWHSPAIVSCLKASSCTHTWCHNPGFNILRRLNPTTVSCISTKQVPAQPVWCHKRCHRWMLVARALTAYIPEPGRMPSAWQCHALWLSLCARFQVDSAMSQTGPQLTSVARQAQVHVHGNAKQCCKVILCSTRCQYQSCNYSDKGSKQSEEVVRSYTSLFQHIHHTHAYLPELEGCSGTSSLGRTSSGATTLASTSHAD